MLKLSNTTRSDSCSETSGETGDIASSFTGKVFYEDLIDKANSVPITRIFQHYNVRLDNNRKSICPFPSHKGGKERTPSFLYYPETNTYFCFGCRKGRSCCDFVAEKEKISKINAAHKILELFESEATNDTISETEDFSERFDIILDFSNTIRNFRQEYPDSESFEFIEDVCLTYDNINTKHNLDIIALRTLVVKLKNLINARVC